MLSIPCLRGEGSKNRYPKGYLTRRIRGDKRKYTRVKVVLIWGMENDLCGTSKDGDYISSNGFT